MLQFHSLHSTVADGSIRKSLPLVLAALPLLLATPALAKQPPRAVRVYTGCVLENFRNPGAEQGATFEAAQDLAKAQCGNLRPAAVAAVHRSLGKRLSASGADPEVAAQAMLEIMVLEQTAAVWAERHPEDVSHAR